LNRQSVPFSKKKKKKKKNPINADFAIQNILKEMVNPIMKEQVTLSIFLMNAINASFHLQIKVL